MITEDVRMLMRKAISASYDTKTNHINPWRNGTFVKVRRHGLNEVELGVIVGRPDSAFPDYSRGYHVRTETTSDPNHYYWKHYSVFGNYKKSSKYCQSMSLELTSLDEYLGNNPSRAGILPSGTIVSITNPKGHFQGRETRTIITGYCAEHRAYWVWAPTDPGQTHCLGVLLNDNGSMLVSPVKNDSVSYIRKVNSNPLPEVKSRLTPDDIIRLGKIEMKYKNERRELKNFYKFPPRPWYHNNFSKDAYAQDRYNKEKPKPKPEPQVVIIYRGELYHA